MSKYVTTSSWRDRSHFLSRDNPKDILNRKVKTKKRNRQAMNVKLFKRGGS